METAYLTSPSPFPGITTPVPTAPTTGRTIGRLHILLPVQCVGMILIFALRCLVSCCVCLVVGIEDCLADGRRVLHSHNHPSHSFFSCNYVSTPSPPQHQVFVPPQASTVTGSPIGTVTRSPIGLGATTELPTSSPSASPTNAPSSSPINPTNSPSSSPTSVSCSV